MSKMPETKFSTKRMSPALASYLKRVAEPKTGSKIVAALRGK